MQEHDVLDRHSVPATAAGFDFQFQRALVELNAAENGAVVGIETLDDVAVVSADGSLTLEQDKFTTGVSGCVYGNKTHNLLNTLSTWLAAALRGEFDCAKTSFRLVTNVACASGLVREISDCNTEQEAKEVIVRIRSLKSELKEYQSLIQLLNQPQAERLFCAICNSTKLLDGQSDISLDVQAALPVEDAYASDRRYIYMTLLGWLHDSAFTAWKGKRPFFVAKQSFVNELGSIKERLRRSQKRELSPSELPIAQTAVDELADRMFIRQIKLVSDDHDETYEASADYLRCIAEKSRLSEEGEILSRDWLDFDAGLKERWDHIFKLKNRLHPKDMSESDVGYDVMSTTLHDCEEVKLAGSPITYPYLARGSYHRLSDILKVGWHPRFSALLTGDAHD